ncbi:MAG: group III truncated hemoglobin [Phycisphaerales bacterium]|nr:group III truncated hemoglobin [Phycisphaerales bacterium]
MQTPTNHLPIAHDGDAQNPNSTITIDNIRKMVELFYERTRTDDLLGPIFNTKVADWDAHYEKMTRFWSSAVLRTGTYSGRPIEAHKFDEPGLLTPAHFVRWVREFSTIAREVFAENDAAVFIELGKRMAASIAARIGVRGVDRLLAEPNKA